MADEATGVDPDLAFEAIPEVTEASAGEREARGQWEYDMVELGDGRRARCLFTDQMEKEAKAASDEAKEKSKEKSKEESKEESK